MKYLLTITILMFSWQGFSKSHELDYTFSLDTSYPASSNSTRGFWQFGLEFEYLGSSIFDYVARAPFIGENILGRLLWTGAMAMAWEKPQYAFFVSNHELGHGTRALAIDSTPTYTWTVGGATGHKDIFSFFLEGFGRFNKGATTAITLTFHALPTEWTSTVVLTAGVNNSAMFSEFLEKEVYYNTGHINQMRAYMRGKMDAYDYARITVLGSNIGDIDQLITIYNAKAYAITLDDIKSGSNNSRIFSFTYWAYAWGVYNYIVNGDPGVKAFEVGGFKLPDVSHFLNRNGLSYKISSSYRATNYSVPFSVEKIYKGEEATEITVGYHMPHKFTFKRSGAFDVRLLYNTNSSYGLELSADRQLGQGIFTVGYNYYESDTLMGERSASNLSDSADAGTELWARYSWVY